MKNKLINLGKEKNIDIEIIESYSNTTEISILNEKEKAFNITDHSAYLIKAIKNKKCVTLVTENINKAQDIIANIENIFLIQENENENKLSSKSIKNKLKKKENLNYNDIKKDLLSLNDLKKEYPFITNIEVNYIHNDVKKQIDNNDASSLDEYYFNEYVASITVEKSGITRIAYASYYSKNYDFDAFRKYIIQKIETLFIKLNSTSCKTNKYKIILKNEVVAALIDTFFSMFDTKNIDLHESILEGKFGEKVFSDKITIIEDPLNPNALANAYFDSEGTPTTYKELVKNGVFTKQINDLEYALKHNEEPTGNAGLKVTNLCIEPGNTSYESLIQELNSGIIIDESYGFHSGVDVKTGDISLQSEGLLVENGEVIKGLNMIILSTNIMEILNNVIKVGNDMSLNDLNIHTPSLLLENITIAGEENE